MTPQQLKNAILQQAIQGKLVEQRAEEGTGQELYKAIQDEKQKLIQESKLKKQKVLPEITEDEISFEIPETWKWVRAGVVLYITMGQSPKAENINNSKLGYEFHQGKSNFSEMFLNKSEVYTTADNKVIEAPAIVMSVRAPVGDVNLLKNKIYIGRGLASFQIYTECNLYYIYYYFLTIKKSLERVSTGSTFKAINSDIVNRIIIPLPPLAEQERIVEKIEELLLLVERYEKAWTRLEELNKKFPLDMQKAILGQAIQGKLVEQRAEEGTGEELYKAIQAEKQELIQEGKFKNQKALPEITEEEIPFEIPETWKWVKLGEISTYSQTKKKINVAEIDTPMWSLDLEDIEKESGKIIRRVMTNDRKISGEKIIFKKEQILYSKLRPYLKKILIAPDKGVCSSELVPFDMIGNCDSRFIVYVLKSAYVDFLINSVTYGVKMPRVGTDTMINLLIPLPPLSEQKRIVEKIEELLPLVEKLK